MAATCDCAPNKRSAQADGHWSTANQEEDTPLASRRVTTLVVAGPRTRWSEAENEAEAAVDVVHQVTGQLTDSCGVLEVSLVERDEGCDVD